MYLFDTDVISALMRRHPSTALIRHLAGLPAEQQFTSAITFGELVYGACKSDRPEYFLRRFDEAISRGVTILPFDRESAPAYGRLRAALERDGISLAEADLRIAAVALANDLTLITGNVRHFARVPGLKVANWLVD